MPDLRFFNEGHILEKFGLFQERAYVWYIPAWVRKFPDKAGQKQLSGGAFRSKKPADGRVSFFAPLHQAIADLISDRKSEKETLTILDCGCGEGTHLKAVCDLLQEKKTVRGIGIDIAKDGILRASKNSGGKLWAVADVANAPFQDRQFDVILSIFSPSNYAEFHRLLKKMVWL